MKYIQKFIKSYKVYAVNPATPNRSIMKDDWSGNQIIKERLDKEYGKVVEDPDWKAELDRLQEAAVTTPADDELNEEIKKLVDIEKRLEACRVATMGRLSELGLIKWKIGPNTSSEYTIVEEVGS